jgi:hypothetical protein
MEKQKQADTAPVDRLVMPHVHVPAHDSGVTWCQKCGTFDRHFSSAACRQIVVVFDHGDAYVYGPGSDGRIDYSEPRDWPCWWPSRITSDFCDKYMIPWVLA